MEYTLVKTYQDGSLDVKYADGKVQNLSGKTVSDLDTLHRELIEYGIAYNQGLEKTVVEIDPEVTKQLVGKKQTLSDEQVAEVLNPEQA